MPYSCMLQPIAQIYSASPLREEGRSAHSCQLPAAIAIRYTLLPLLRCWQWLLVPVMAAVAADACCLAAGCWLHTTSDGRRQIANRKCEWGMEAHEAPCAVIQHGAPCAMHDAPLWSTACWAWSIGWHGATRNNTPSRSMQRTARYTRTKCGVWYMPRSMPGFPGGWVVGVPVVHCSRC
jgi:hypothetical protein